MSDPTKWSSPYPRPLNEDGTVNEAFLKAASRTFPPMSTEEPPDPASVRPLILSAIDQIEYVRLYLWYISAMLPQPENQDAMLDDQVPCDEATHMAGALRFIDENHLQPATEGLRGTVVTTAGWLRRNFEERHTRYRAQQHDGQDA